MHQRPATLCRYLTMNRLIALILLTAGATFVTTPTIALNNNALYQWVTKDGTPTYSPDPPPDGVDYVVVDSNLQPMAVQPAKSPAMNSPAQKPQPQIAAKTKAPQPEWKPVRYAQDPALAQQKRNKTKSASKQPQVAALSETTSMVANEACLLLKREKLILESSLAKAKSDADMDNAILALHKKTMQYRQQCS